jgi:hypothetical protein
VGIGHAIAGSLSLEFCARRDADDARSAEVADAGEQAACPIAL